MLIASALWGVVAPDDRIPAYRLSIGARVLLESPAETARDVAEVLARAGYDVALNDGWLDIR